MRKKEMLRLLEERADRIAALEQRAEKNEDTIERYRAREQAIVDSLASAQNESKQRLREAEAKADALIGAARQTAESAVQAAEASAREIVEKAETYRNSLVQSAKAEADALVTAAKAESSAILGRTQAAVAEYKESLTRYNALLAESAADAREKAAQYAALLSDRGLPVPEITKNAETLADAPFAEKVELPDVTDNPAQLMRNIYTLEKREIPEEAQEQPAFPTPPAEEVVAEERDEPGAPEEPKATEEPKAQKTAVETDEEEQWPDLAPRPNWEETPVETVITETIVETDMPEDAPEMEAPVPEELEEEAFPDLAPRPEPAEWRPEDEAAEPEWQPENASMEEDVPTVSELTGERPVDDEVEMSLDALLDEIIRAGE